MTSLTTIVIAKAPVAGRVKTRLCPPCTPQEAAQLAEAALRDTFAVITSTPATRRLCALDGAPGSWLPDGIDVTGQRGDGLDQRLAAAFADAGCPAVLVGMDTPQLTAAQLEELARPLEQGEADATLGLTEDGGYWGIGLSQSRDEYFHGVPMSREDTGELQLQRLREAGLRVRVAATRLTDVDDARAALLVAGLAPHTAFAAAVAQLALADRALSGERR